MLGFWVPCHSESGRSSSVANSVCAETKKKYSPLLAYLKVLSILWGEWWLYCKLPSCWVHQNKGRTSWHQLVRGQWPLCSLGRNTDTMHAAASDIPCVSIALGDMSHVIITTTVSFHESRLKDCQRVFRILRVPYPKPLSHKETNTCTPRGLFLCGELWAGVFFHRVEEYLLAPLLPSCWHIPCLHYSKDRTIHLQIKWMLSLLPSEGNVSLV